MNNIFGEPKSDYIFEFQVVVPIDNGDYNWVGNYEYAEDAYSVAEHVHGVVAHNVRVRHKEKRK